MRDILRDDDAEIAAIAGIIRAVDPDVLLLTDFDYDAGLAALTRFAQRLAQESNTYSHLFAYPPNSGVQSGHDMDGDGRTNGYADAFGYGKFPGDGGMAILSRIPIDASGSRDFSQVLWKDLPGATLPEVDNHPFPSVAAQNVARLSSVGHWQILLTPQNAPPFSLLAYSATPPVFDGPEDANGLRAGDETLFWLSLLDGHFGPPPTTFVLAGNANLDPEDGEGNQGPIRRLLADPRLVDPHPQSEGGRVAADEGQRGDPARETADWPDDGPGNLRVTYVLPSTGWTVLDAGVFWPAPGTPYASLLGDDGLAAGPHRLVWVDIGR